MKVSTEPEALSPKQNGFRETSVDVRGPSQTNATLNLLVPGAEPQRGHTATAQRPGLQLLPLVHQH